MFENIITNEWTSTVQKLVKQVVNDPSTYVGARYLPSVAIPVQEIFVEVIKATGGLTNEHRPGSDPKYVSDFGTFAQSYSPPAYKEKILYGEQRILYLRKLGQNDRNVRGVQQYMELSIDRLNRRLEARMEKLRWDTIFNGGFSFMGEVLSFNFPVANRVQPLSGAWSSNGTTANNSADPISDLQYWINGGTSTFRKYNITKLIMNPNTARWLLTNSNVRAYVTSFGANPNIGDFELNKVLQFLIPGCPPAEIYKGWFQNETENEQTGDISVSDAVYFIPDGYIFFETSLPNNDKIGEMVQGIHLASGTVDSPGYGKYLVVDDCTASGTRGGPSNPFIDIVAGFSGGPKIDRPFDVLTAYVGP